MIFRVLLISFGLFGPGAARASNLFSNNLGVKIISGKISISIIYTIASKYSLLYAIKAKVFLARLRLSILVRF